MDRIGQRMSGKAQLTMTPDGAMLHDRSRLGERADPSWFDPGSRAQRAAVEGGRGAAWRVRTPAGEAVLRHYRRGGVVARFNADRYLWQGEERTRPFREFRLLEAMAGDGLPTPLPLAARYQRTGPWYRADLLTLAIEGAQTLAQHLVEAPSAIDWPAIGAAIGRVHARGYFHADLNAHNLLLRGAECWLIDFDRGEHRIAGPAWQQDNLRRLRRSLDKLEAAQRVVGFEAAWESLRVAHARGVERAS
jgi:3-deoxy-D-manno-octulosonic acid kinase